MKGSLSGRLVRNVRAVNGVLVYSSSAPQVGIPDDQTAHSMLFRFTATPPQRISALEKHDLYPKKGSQGQLYQAVSQLQTTWHFGRESLALELHASTAHIRFRMSTKSCQYHGFWQRETGRHV